MNSNVKITRYELIDTEFDNYLKSRSNLAYYDVILDSDICDDPLVSIINDNLTGSLIHIGSSSVEIVSENSYIDIYYLRSNNTLSVLGGLYSRKSLLIPKWNDIILTDISIIESTIDKSYYYDNDVILFDSCFITNFLGPESTKKELVTSDNYLVQIRFTYNDSNYLVLLSFMLSHDLYDYFRLVNYVGCTDSDFMISMLHMMNNKYNTRRRNQNTLTNPEQP